jgi:hypothetical protein
MQQAISLAVLATAYIPEAVQRFQAIEKIWKLGKLVEHVLPLFFS